MSRRCVLVEQLISYFQSRQTSPSSGRSKLKTDTMVTRLLTAGLYLIFKRKIDHIQRAQTHKFIVTSTDNAYYLMPKFYVPQTIVLKSFVNNHTQLKIRMIVTNDRNEQIEGCVMAKDEHFKLTAYKKEEQSTKKHEQNQHRDRYN